jgi:spore maturation protein SpmB
MLNFAHTVITYVIAHWPAISALAGGGAGLSVILQYVIHKLHIDSKKLAYTLIHLLSIGAAASAFYLDNVNAVGAYAGLVIAAQTVHRFIVSPYYSKYILPYLTFLSESAPQPTTQYEAPVLPVQTPEPAFVS